MQSDLKKKAISCVVDPEILLLLEADAKAGKAESANKMLSKIAKMYYRRKIKK